MGVTTLLVELVKKSFEQNTKMVFALKVFKKTSPNSKVTVYLGKRDFVDNITKIESVGECFVESNLQFTGLNSFIFFRWSRPDWPRLPKRTQTLRPSGMQLSLRTRGGRSDGSRVPKRSSHGVRWNPGHPKEGTHEDAGNELCLSLAQEPITVELCNRNAWWRNSARTLFPFCSNCRKTRPRP